MTRRPLIFVLALVAALVFLPNLQDATGFSPYYLVFTYFLFFWITQASSWSILSGYTGYFSFGQGAFYGVGVYATADLMGRQGFNYFATIPIAAAGAAVLAAGVGAVAFRLRSLRGEVFALLTLAVTFALAALADFSTWVDGGAGIPLRVPHYPAFLGDFQDMLFRLGLGAAGLAVVTAYLIQHSRFGWGLFSIHDEEDVAEEVGVPTFRYKMAAITISGFLGGLSGSIAALQIGYITPSGIFNLEVPLFVIVMSVLGGRRHWLGPVIGALLIYTLRERLTSAGADEWAEVVLGSVLVLVILFAPEGLHTRLRRSPRRAIVAGAAAAVAIVVVSLAAVGTAIDRLGVGLAVATVVVIAKLPARRRAIVAAPPVSAPVGNTVP